MFRFLNGRWFVAIRFRFEVVTSEYLIGDANA